MARDTGWTNAEQFGKKFHRFLKSNAMSGYDYEYGEELASVGDVSGLAGCRQADGRVRLVGYVRTPSSRETASVDIDTRRANLAAHTCTCFDHQRYIGVCAHCLALSLTFLARESDLLADEVDNPTPIIWVKTPPKKPLSEAQVRAFRQEASPESVEAVALTSPEIQDLISTYADQLLNESRHLQDVVDDATGLPADGPVDILCTLRSQVNERTGNSDWTLGLKVSCGKVAYVVKSISDLTGAWQTSAPFTYGKRLAFRHRREAFTDRANALLELIAGIVDTQVSILSTQERHSPTHASHEQQRRASDKALPLSSSQLFEVLRIERGAEVTLETEVLNAAHRVVIRRVTVLERDPFVRVSLARDGGVWKLDIEPRGLTAIAGRQALALVTADELYLCSADLARGLGLFFGSLLPRTEALTIRDDDMPALVSAVLPALRRHTDLSAPEDLDRFLPITPDLEFDVGTEQDKVYCRAFATYGDVRMGLFDDVYDTQPVRDMRHEMLAQQLVGRLFPEGDHATPNYATPYQGEAPKRGGHRNSWGYVTPHVDPHFPMRDDEAYYRLFTEGLAALDELGDVYLSDTLRNVSVRQAPHVIIEASVTGGLLDLALSSDDMEPHELMAYLSSWRRRQRFVRLDSGDIVRLDSSIAALEGLVEGLGIDERSLVEGGAKLPANRTLFVDAMLKRQEGVSFNRNDAFRRIVRDFETVADADFQIPASVTATLRPYQREGFRWLCTLGKVGFGGILADDMGLGKTVQAIAYLAHVQEVTPAEELKASLVVCPASLVYNWEAEIERFCPSMHAVCVTGTKGERMHTISHARAGDVLITSYDLMKRDIDAYVRGDYHVVILDEAHYIKNASTLAAKASKRLPAKVRLALTGTPIENRLLELWSIFDFLMPGVLGTSESFRNRFSNPIATGDEVATERLRRLVSPFVLRRLKRDVLADLPEKSESIVSSSLEGEQAKLYRAHAQRLRMQIEHQLPAEFAGMRLQILAELMRLRQICCDPALAFDDYDGPSAKLDTCMELVAEAIEGDHQILIFSQFTTMLDIIARRLDDLGTTYLLFRGSTPKEQRKRLVERFQAGEASVFLISLKAGGVGLNLTAADIVIHYDPWWNVAAEDQATDRTHRIGQTREVSVFKLIAKDTIEEKIQQMQERKRALADSVIGGEAVGTGTITREDLLALLEV